MECGPVGRGGPLAFYVWRAVSGGGEKNVFSPKVRCGFHWRYSARPTDTPLTPETVPDLGLYVMGVGDISGIFVWDDGNTFFL